MNAFLPGYTLVAEWAERHGHEIALVVTPPIGASDRYDEQAQPFVLDLPKTTSVLVTGKLRSVAAPVIAGLAPDLVISAAFPRLIPAEILAIPRHGAVNLHPSALPSGRGPNPARLIYEGAATLGATLHRTEAEFDTGAILSQRERPLPDDLSGPAIFQAWMEMLREVLEEGAARSLAGEPGVPQDPARASEAPAFTADEAVLDLSEPFRCTASQGRRPELHRAARPCPFERCPANRSAGGSRADRPSAEFRPRHGPRRTSRRLDRPGRRRPCPPLHLMLVREVARQ